MWNYRIVRHKDNDREWYQLHEAYYNKDGEVCAITEEPISFYTDADTKEDAVAELTKALELALRDIKENDIFDIPKEWPKADWEL